MSKQKSPNIYMLDSANLGILSPSSLGEDQVVAPTSNGIALKNKCEFNLTRIKRVTSAQVLALNATPIQIIAAPGVGYSIIVNKVVIRHGTGTAYAGIAAGEDLVLKYTNGSGAQCSSVIETTGFLDQATTQIRYANGPASTGSNVGDVTPVANAAVVLHLLNGEITTGTFDLLVLVDYNIIPTDFTIA